MEAAGIYIIKSDSLRKGEKPMKTYESPIIVINEGLAEGVYAASGDGCYTTTAYIHQTPQTGRGDYRIQVNARHDADHNCNGQILTISFNQAVDFVGANGSLIDGSGTNTIRIQYGYWNNHTDNIGLGDVIVSSEPGLAITGVSMDDEGWRQ